MSGAVPAVLVECLHQLLALRELVVLRSHVANLVQRGLVGGVGARKNDRMNGPLCIIGGIRVKLREEPLTAWARLQLSQWQKQLVWTSQSALIVYFTPPQ